jgi:uncharacterized protein DUF6249
LDDLHFAWPFLIPIVAIICSFAFVIVLTLSRSRVRELEVRERIAMIERGMVPPPEVDPRGFDRAMDRVDRLDRYRYRTRYRSPGRHRRAGVTLMGVGFGLMLLIGVGGGSINEGIGVGGFLVIMGLAFFINSLFEQPHDDYPPISPRANGPSGPISPEPPRHD